MKSGHCHASAFNAPLGPLDAITEFQGKIQYVAMTGNKEEWIVGCHNEAYKSRGCEADMISYLKGVIDATKEVAIERVQLGRTADKWIVSATRQYNFDSGSDFFNFDSGSDFFKKSEGSRLRSLH